MAKKKLGLTGIIDPASLDERLAKLIKIHSNNDSPGIARAKALEILKQANTEGRKRIEVLLSEERRGTRCAKRISQLQDVLIKSIYRFTLSSIAIPENRSVSKRVTIVAVGGYGRGTLAPGSDIDLLFLLPGMQTTHDEKTIEYTLYMLWDMGFKVGHATRDIDESIHQSQRDMTVRTSILEARYVCGKRKLFQSLINRFSKEVVEGTAGEFIETKLLERDRRHKKSGESRYLVEPDVKNGKGGFRDLHTLFWIGKYYYKVSRPSQLVKAGLFSAHEFRQFKRAEDFFWVVRCHMHFLTGRAQERLIFDIQREIAKRLNYSTHRGTLDAEHFMKRYFLIAKQVGVLTLVVCSQLEEKQTKTINQPRKTAPSFSQKGIFAIPDENDFINDNGRINVADRECFARDPVNLIRLFNLANENRLDFHPNAFQLVTRSLKLINQEIQHDKRANALFLQILCSCDRSAFLLRKMNESGVLGKFIPAFGRIVAMMQFNMYHHFTVDEHLLRAVGSLTKIEKGKLAHEHPLCHRIMPEIPDKTPLYVAVFLHDIAKGGKGNHSVSGAKIAKKLCPRLGLSKEQTELVSWLILEHLTMSNTAQSRDLSDPKTIETFANIVQTMERLQYLLIVTVCDIKAVGPGIWNGWKGQLLRTLYEETRLLLTGHFAQQRKEDQLHQAKSVLTGKLTHWTKEELIKILALPYDSYFLSTNSEAQLRHMHFIKKTTEKPASFAYDIHARSFEQVTEISILAPDHFHLLSTIAGVCAHIDANIVSAQIHTLHDGRALDRVLINQRFDNEEDERRRANRIGKQIGEALSGKTSPQQENRALKTLLNRKKTFQRRSGVLIDNSLSNRFSVIEVKCLDRTGLLAALANGLSNLNLNIVSAHISTFGEKVVDVFYVTDLTGHKITATARKDKIRKALIKMLTS